MCGGTEFSGILKIERYGLSPRVRGNLFYLRSIRLARRSIPACAGEPQARPAGPLRLWVYPRVCGGTARTSRPMNAPKGLSPRVRGNQCASGESEPGRRSIPACAGEPNRFRLAMSLQSVYPRVCGGTQEGQGRDCAGWGLSPRVRGNRGQAGDGLTQDGSIPACAGEPRAVRVIPPLETVYPRVCGGTHVGETTAVGEVGLSPRVRGNRYYGCGRGHVQRSIPACAGEPDGLVVIDGHLRVYPRVCGGTHGGVIGHVVHHGLSPRVRGNPQRQRISKPPQRSIPACAGEPCQGFWE